MNLVRKRMTHDTDTVPKNLPLGGLSPDHKSYFCSSSFWQKTYSQQASASWISTLGPVKPSEVARKESRMRTKEGQASATKLTSCTNSRQSLNSPTPDEEAFSDQKLNLAVFSPSLDLCDLPKSR